MTDRRNAEDRRIFRHAPPLGPPIILFIERQPAEIRFLCCERRIMMMLCYDRVWISGPVYNISCIEKSDTPNRLVAWAAKISKEKTVFPVILSTIDYPAWIHKRIHK